MKAAYAKVPFQVQLREEPIREPGPNEVLVRIRACGVCGTDLHIARKMAQDWTRIGHEVAGEVEKLGPGVTTVKPGDKVIVENCTFCGVCRNCKSGRVEHCLSWTTLGPQAGAAEYITVKENSLYSFDDLPFTHAAIAEPLTVALDVTGVAEVPLDSTVCVMGPGPIGLMCVKLAKLRGAKTVVLVGNSHSTTRLAVGKELGADDIVFADKVNVAEHIKERYPDGIDRIIVTSPPKTLLDAVKIANFGAIIGFIGIDVGGEQMVTFDVNEVHFKRLQIRASHAVPNLGFPTALDMLRRKVIDPVRMVTHVFPLDRTEEALRVAETKKGEVVKVVVEC
ncbi:MAG: alcohol dehydrogenase catalytic domain-containing protein [Armatimonadota bacterium]|nr:alcohol dehydrogenase catalytic domain-containing protein [Armatimonadota bacterium]